MASTGSSAAPKLSIGTLGLQAMADLEVDHGGPRATSTRDIATALDCSMTTSRRIVRALEFMGLAKQHHSSVRGQVLWILTPLGRQPFDLPNDHKAGA